MIHALYPTFFFTWSTHSHLCLTKFSVCTAFIGNEDSCMPGSIEISTNDDLETIAENTQNSWLMHYVLINKIYTLFYFRQHLAVTKVAEKYEATQKGKRALDFIPQYYQGLCKHTEKTFGFLFSRDHLLFVSYTSHFCIKTISAALWLARKTKDSKWRDIGEEAVKSHALFAKHGTWNFEHKVIVLLCLYNQVNLFSVPYCTWVALYTTDFHFLYIEFC